MRGAAYHLVCRGDLRFLTPSYFPPYIIIIIIIISLKNFTRL